MRTRETVWEARHKMSVIRRPLQRRQGGNSWKDWPIKQFCTATARTRHTSYIRITTNVEYRRRGYKWWRFSGPLCFLQAFLPAWPRLDRSLTRRCEEDFFHARYSDERWRDEYKFYILFVLSIVGALKLHFYEHAIQGFFRNTTSVKLCLSVCQVLRGETWNVYEWNLR